jgi:putative NADH-flavin reductase
VPWQHGDLADLDGVRAVAAGHDAVVTANGPTREPGGDPFAFAGLIEQVAAAVGSARLLVVGGAGSLLAAPGIRLVDTPEFPEEYRQEALATAAALELLRSAGPDLDWTYLSPAPAFPAGEPTGRYVVGDDEPVGTSISGPDFARALVDELERPAHRRTRFTVAAPPA